jgi:hypothetical protein
MAFTVEEFRDLLRLLEERPEWRAELRRAVLTEELLTLPELVRTLAEARLDIVTLDLADLKGDSLERRYREHGPAYFGRLVRRSRVLTAAEVMDLLEPIVERGELSALEADEVALADLVIRERRREDNTEVYLVVEVSWGVGPYEVERVAHRAELLRRTGVLAMPVVAGKAILPEAARRAQELRVWQLTDGQVAVPEP